MGNIENRAIKDFSIIRLNKGNLSDLAKLYTDVYHKDLGIDLFSKKYDTAFTGLECLGFVAYNKDQKPVAYYGVIPCFIQYENKIMLSAQPADTITHPDYRNRGLFNLLANKTFELCEESGIKLIFGFPNQNSYPISINRQGWIEIEKLNRFELSSDHFFSRFLFRSSKENRQMKLKALSLSKEWLYNSVIDEGFGGICRDNAYFHYKSFSNNHILKIPSAELWVKINGGMIIGDIKLTGNDYQQFFREIKNLARQLGINKISFQVSPGCLLNSLFSEYYEAIPSFPVIFKDLGSSIPLEKIKFTFSDIDIF
jgi:hypothetical protein